MSKMGKSGRTAALTGFLTAALVSIVLVGVAAAAPLAPPVNIEPPTITGTPRVGEALTAQNGTWLNNPTTFQYRWLRCNAGGNNCTLLAADGIPHGAGMAKTAI